MRPSPSGLSSASSSSSSDQPAVEEDASLPDHHSGSSTPTTTASHYLDTSVNHHDGYDWFGYAHQSPTHADDDIEQVDGDEDGDEDEQDEDEDEVEEDDHDMLDDEGGAPLTHFNMDTPDEDDSVSLPEITFSSPEPETAEPTADIALLLPPPLHPVIHFAPLEPAPEPAVLAPLQEFQQFQQLQQFQDVENELEVDVAAFHHMAQSNANPMSLGPENPGVSAFLELWAWQSRRAGRVSEVHDINQVRHASRRRVVYGDLKGDECDLQGIDWSRLGITRNLARQRRMDTFHNYVNKPGSDIWHGFLPDRLLPPVENYFRYQSMDIMDRRRAVSLRHFQLRNILGCASRSRVFYPSSDSIREVDPTTGRDKTAIKFDNTHDSHVSTLTAGEDVLIVGGFYGDYRYRYLNSEDEHYDKGRLTENVSGITNHVQVHSSRRSSSPSAAFASNDFGFRVVDLATNMIISEIMYSYAMNCSALSPDKRLRVLVGDHQNVRITDAENGQVLQDLAGHRDFGFACDWAPDGWTVATANQDKSIRIWDARKWTNSNGESTSVAVVRTQLAGARSLRFSPLGSGKRLLVAAEEADFINVIDAQTFNTRQTVDLFGELGGISFANGGQDLIALSCDSTRGGILRLGRCDAGSEDTFNYGRRLHYPRESSWTPGYDWLQSPEQVAELSDSQETLRSKRRKAAMSEDWVGF